MTQYNNQTLLDRYVADVGRRLPGRTRADVKQELRYTLLDMLEDRLGAENGEPPAGDALAVEILREMGPPATIAARYTGNSCLVGPQLTPVFWLVTRIVLMARV